MSNKHSHYATIAGRVIWCERGRWSVVAAGADTSEVRRFRSKSAANRLARWMRSTGNSVRVRAYRRRDTRINGRGYLEPIR